MARKSGQHLLSSVSSLKKVSLKYIYRHSGIIKSPGTNFQKNPLDIRNVLSAVLYHENSVMKNISDEIKRIVSMAEITGLTMERLRSCLNLDSLDSWIPTIAW